jgi:hypothetical protein
VKEQLAGVNDALGENAAAYDERLKRILLDIATEQLAMDGMSTKDVLALNEIAKGWGLIDETTATAVENVVGATSKFTESGGKNVGEFYAGMVHAFNNTKQAALDTEGTVKESAGRLAETGLSMKEAMAEAALDFGTKWQEADTVVAEKTTAIATHVQTMADTVKTKLADQIPGALEPVKTEFSSLEVAVREKVQAVILKIQELISNLTGIQVNIPLPGAATAGAGSTTNPRRVGGYQHGGRFRVMGPPGLDNVLVAFRATRGEEVEVTPAGQTGSRPGRQTNIHYGDTIINDRIAAEMWLEQQRRDRIRLAESYL